MRDNITLSIRQKILAGEWEAGRRLPSNQALAETYQASVGTVIKALLPLAREGMLKRVRKLGTFVAEGRVLRMSGAQGSPVRHGVGLLNHSSPQKPNSNELFLQQLTLHLQHQLEEREREYRLWQVPFRPHDDLRVREELKNAVEAETVGRLVVLSAAERVREVVDGLGIPVVFNGSGVHRDDTRTVGFDMRYFVEQALTALAANGKRKIAVISMLKQPPFLPSRGAPASVTRNRRFEEGFQDAERRFGVEFRREWLYFPQQNDDILPFDAVANTEGRLSFAQYGYRAFSRLWQSPERPDGLIVYPDVVAQGVAMAMQHCRVPVPEALQVVFHKNSGVDLYLPFPATFLRSNIALLATTLIRVVDGELNGPLWLPLEQAVHPGDPAHLPLQ